MAKAIPGVRSGILEGIPIGFIPQSPDAPFALRAEVNELEVDQLRQLGILLLKRSRELRPGREVGQEARLLALEIDDSLRELVDRNAELARRNGLQRAQELVGRRSGDSAISNAFRAARAVTL